MARLDLIVVFMAFLMMGCSQSTNTYALNCATPLDHWYGQSIGHMRFVQPLYIRTDGSVLWNKEIISDAVLRRYMSQFSTLNPQPQIVLEVAPSTPCERVNSIRKIMDDTPICKGPYSLCSEGSNWEQWP